MTIIEFYQYLMSSGKTSGSRLRLIHVVLSCCLIGSCNQRIGKEPIPKLGAFNESLDESALISEKSLSSLELNELIQYLKLHEQAGWSDINEGEIAACLVTFKNNAELYELVSDFYLIRGDLDQALLYTSKAEDGGANSAEFFKKKANVHMTLGEYGLAIDYLNKAVQVNSNDPDIYLLKGEVYMKLEDSISALKYKEQAFVHDSSRNNIAFDLAHIYASINQKEKSHSMVDYLIEQSYKKDELYFLKVKLLREEGRQQAANQLLSVMLNEGNLGAGEQLVAYFMQQNLYDSAIQYSTEVLYKDSLNMSALGAKAMSFDHKGYFTSALMYYNQMLAVDSLNKEAIEGVRKVNGKIAYLRKLREQREAIPTFDFATEKKKLIN
ncbi:tetratricopeptide repeat protein [Reichenbachiella sp.]|uniref:tetratricopeptide repeat protein n=1 Tax=Reichenbachiella sp. TaxID=2184521 RepID=UPI003BB1A477